MPFDPALPASGTKIKSAELRNQLNALNDHSTYIEALVVAQAATIANLETQIAGILARIVALENPPLASSGFGEAGANGKLTIIGMFAGKPMYQAAGGWYFCWNPDGGMWICRDALPGTGDLSNNRYADNGYAADIKDVVWGPGFNPGMMPYGIVS